MLKQISIEQFEDEALMISKMDMLVHPHYVVLIIFIFLHQEL